MPWANKLFVLTREHSIFTVNWWGRDSVTNTKLWTFKKRKEENEQSKMHWFIGDCFNVAQRIRYAINTNSGNFRNTLVEFCLWVYLQKIMKTDFYIVYNSQKLSQARAEAFACIGTPDGFVNGVQTLTSTLDVCTDSRSRKSISLLLVSALFIPTFCQTSSTNELSNPWFESVQL